LLLLLRAKINKIIIVITNDINVIPLFFIFSTPFFCLSYCISSVCFMSIGCSLSCIYCIKKHPEFISKFKMFYLIRSNPTLAHIPLHARLILEYNHSLFQVHQYNLLFHSIHLWLIFYLNQSFPLLYMLENTEP